MPCILCTEKKERPLTRAKGGREADVGTLGGPGPANRRGRHVPRGPLRPYADPVEAIGDPPD